MRGFERKCVSKTAAAETRIRRFEMLAIYNIDFSLLYIFIRNAEKKFRRVVFWTGRSTGIWKHVTKNSAQNGYDNVAFFKLTTVTLVYCLLIKMRLSNYYKTQGLWKKQHWTGRTSPAISHISLRRFESRDGSGIRSSLNGNWTTFFCAK